MFEARLVQGSLFKKIIEAIRELVTDANLDCNEQGITMQVLMFKTFFLLLRSSSLRQWIHRTSLYVLWL
jgi:hypothetical protein